MVGERTSMNMIGMVDLSPLRRKKRYLYIKGETIHLGKFLCAKRWEVGGTSFPVDHISAQVGRPISIPICPVVDQTGG
jgi:hypothetical protein